MAIRRMSHQPRPPRRPLTDMTALLVNSRTGDDCGGNGENQYNNSPGNHRVKLSLGRPKQVCDRGRRWFTGQFFSVLFIFLLFTSDPSLWIWMPPPVKVYYTAGPGRPLSRGCVYNIIIYINALYYIHHTHAACVGTWTGNSVAVR